LSPDSLSISRHLTQQLELGWGWGSTTLFVGGGWDPAELRTGTGAGTQTGLRPGDAGQLGAASTGHTSHRHMLVTLLGVTPTRSRWEEEDAGCWAGVR